MKLWNTNMAKNYVHNGTKSLHKPHGTKHEELNELFQAVGWIGRRRHPVLFLKSVPQFERSTSSAGKA